MRWSDFNNPLGYLLIAWGFLIAVFLGGIIYCMVNNIG